MGLKKNFHSNIGMSLMSQKLLINTKYQFE